MQTILVIEDSNDIRENLAEVLEISDYKVIVAENGMMGVQLATKEIPDLILCDVMMPELDGFGVLNILKKKPQTADIPFIFLTAKESISRTLAEFKDEGLIDLKGGKIIVLDAGKLEGIPN